MTAPARAGTPVSFRNVVVLLGIVVTTVGLVYFATEFVDRLSEWTRVVALGLLTVVYVSLGVHFESQGGTEVVPRRGWRWFRVTTALYFLGVFSAFVGVIVFLGMDGLDPLVKALAVLLLGIALILVAAWRMRGPADEPAA